MRFFHDAGRFSRPAGCRVPVFFFAVAFLVTASRIFATVTFDLDFDPPALLRPAISSAPEISALAAVVMDATTGTVLYSKNSALEVPPASMTKLMTMHLAQKAVAEGRASMDEIVPIGIESWAQNQPPHSSLMFLEPGQIVTLGELLTGLAVPSGNDAAVAVAMRLSGSVEAFAKEMTAEARLMGLSRTRFTEPSGYSPQNITTAEEFAFFAREYIRAHPESLAAFHSLTEFAYPKASNVREALRSRPGTIVQTSPNTLLRTFPGVDGLKTGFIEESGYNITLTAQREGTRFIAVILGAPSTADRSRDGSTLLSWAFDSFRTVQPRIPQIEPARLWKGREKYASLVPEQGLEFTAPAGRAGQLWFSVQMDGPLIAPVQQGQRAGYMVFADESGELYRAPLVSATEHRRGNIFVRIWHSIVLLFVR